METGKWQASCRTVLCLPGNAPIFLLLLGLALVQGLSARYQLAVSPKIMLDTAHLDKLKWRIPSDLESERKTENFEHTLSSPI